MELKTNVVLVHGAWADGSSWSKVISLLDERSFNVTAVQLPLTSLEDDIAITRNALSIQKGATVLVGHSYGGAVITGAADKTSVSALVYVAGWGLDQGESLDGLYKQGPSPAGAASIHLDANEFFWIDSAGFAQAFAADVDRVEARVMAAAQKPLSLKAFAGVSGPPAWKDIPSWYMVATNDQMIPPQIEEFMAKRMGATVRRVPSSHAAMISHPEQVVDLILAAVQSNIESSQPAILAAAS